MTVYEQLTEEARKELDLAFKFYINDLSEFFEDINRNADRTELTLKNAYLLYSFCYSTDSKNFTAVDFDNLFLK